MINVKIENAYNLFKNSDTYKVTERDIRAGMVVLSKKGYGCIESFDRRTEEVDISIDYDIRKRETFKIQDLCLLPTSIKPSFLQELGEIAVNFAMLENRMKDFLGFIFGMKPHKQRIFVLKHFAYAKSADTINEILLQIYLQDDEILLNWKKYFISIKEFATVRNNLMHGDFFNSGEEYSFYNPKKAKSMNLKENEKFDIDKLSTLKDELNAAYHRILIFFGEICDDAKKRFELIE